MFVGPSCHYQSPVLLACTRGTMKNVDHFGGKTHKDSINSLLLKRVTAVFVRNCNI